jgi:hypothetical protein
MDLEVPNRAWVASSEGVGKRTTAEATRRGEKEKGAPRTLLLSGTLKEPLLERDKKRSTVRCRGPPRPPRERGKRKKSSRFFSHIIITTAMVIHW